MNTKTTAGAEPADGIGARVGAGTDELVIARTFDAPRALVFSTWTTAERFRRWWGPAGFDIGVTALDFRPGGMFHYSMTAADGGRMWGRIVYREIVEPERIVFLVSFSDPERGITRAPFFDPWPLEVLTTVTLEERDGRTTMTIRARPHEATDAERAMFASVFPSMRDGYGGSLDKLAGLLAELRS